LKVFHLVMAILWAEALVRAQVAQAAIKVALITPRVPLQMRQPQLEDWAVLIIAWVAQAAALTLA
jgi:hypothetical protein